MEITVKDLASLLNGTIEGDPDLRLTRPGKIEEGGAGVITFLGNAKYEPYLYTTSASAVLVNRNFQPKSPIQATLIRVDDVYACIALLLEKFGAPAPKSSGIHPQSIIHPSAKLGQNISIGPLTIIEEDVEIGDNVYIEAQVFIGRGSKIGADCRFQVGVKILHECSIGQRCVFHPGVVIGADGFGFAQQEDGSYKKINQIGNVIIEDDVEIGANSTVDRASIGSTILRRGVKLDNLVQIAHNVEIGEDTVIAAQAGVAGSSKVGKNCQIGGQVAVAGHLKVADGTRVQGKSGVASNVKQPNQALFGYPAIDYHQFIRAHTIFKQLPELAKRLHELEKQLSKNED
ncbi:MAG TPA: UDP-3-O-(3-hydroxymyristoyl)glucosamine N-acyltransferase [Haliscomenobacter sp.]|uniref:UDP-3-O-(3-hydroxymyristoyl)glucosamine N-acyltransferase n=1 Tax=Haliscomenobacter sp. TaxID=2717303 RepID=UPI002CB03EB5|nr:UDP-3-O-(3-hydroxymyristoyl)glucosamine N-acyltransferase [Haliscomenobacter sp.]HOY17033.1 UDP-3-O-(3-hydroxymyristoyl)glucosamine N-acyltransferase [Haliscomenobacter sp.]HPH19408.1 UDP-3-O-(3-hydroxymyristoyl)glucosamine N-acyltransferase [Haliscomenobacter sp.]